VKGRKRSTFGAPNPTKLLQVALAEVLVDLLTMRDARCCSRATTCRCIVLAALAQRSISRGSAGEVEWSFVDCIHSNARM
jgi:hypothetical protein